MWSEKKNKKKGEKEIKISIKIQIRSILLTENIKPHSLEVIPYVFVCIGKLVPYSNLFLL